MNIPKYYCHHLPRLRVFLELLIYRLFWTFPYYGLHYFFVSGLYRYTHIASPVTVFSFVNIWRWCWGGRFVKLQFVICFLIHLTQTSQYLRRLGGLFLTLACEGLKAGSNVFCESCVSALTVSSTKLAKAFHIGGRQLLFCAWFHVRGYNVKRIIPHLFGGYYICTMCGYKISVNVHGFHGLRPQEKYLVAHDFPCPLSSSRVAWPFSSSSTALYIVNWWRYVLTNGVITYRRRESNSLLRE